MFKIEHMLTLLVVKDATNSITKFGYDAIIEYEDDAGPGNFYGAILFRTKKAAEEYIESKTRYKIIDYYNDFGDAVELYSDSEPYDGDTLQFKKKEFMVVEAGDV